MGLGERILIIQEDLEIIEILSMYLKKENYQVKIIQDYSGLQVIETFNPDLIILDTVLKGADGFALCTEIREITDVPILFFSYRDSDADKIQGFAVGADDYISKLTSPAEIVARVKAQLRRDRLRKFSKTPNRFIKYKGLGIDIETCTVHKDGKVVNLSSKELQLLILLAHNPDRIFSHEQLFQLVWNSPSFGDPRTVKVHINNLRKKIERDPSNPNFIITVRGLGYKFKSNEA
jgi:DNA-binding response OmpR family regulator